MSQSKTQRDSAISFVESLIPIHLGYGRLNPFSKSIQNPSYFTTSTMREMILLDSPSQRGSSSLSGLDTPTKSCRRETDGYIWCSTQPVAKAGIASKLTPQSSIPKTTHIKSSSKLPEESLDLTLRMIDYSTITSRLRLRLIEQYVTQLVEKRNSMREGL